MVTFSPVAAAPLAKTKVANALSKSSLNKIKVLPFAVESGSETSIAQGVAFSTLTMYVPFSVWAETKRFPVTRHQASASRGKPASVARISKHFSWS